MTHFEEYKKQCAKNARSKFGRNENNKTNGCQHFEQEQNGMKEAGKLRRIGPDKGGKWEVIEG